MDDEPDQRLIGRASRRASKTRQRLLDAALYVFNRRGVDACSIEEITESADVGKGTFYRHYMDKLDILKTLLDLAVDDLVGRMPSGQTAPVSLEDRTTQIMTAHMTFFAERSDLLALFLQGQSMVASRPAAVPGLQPPFTRYISEMTHRLASALPQTTRESQAAHRLALAIAAAACGTITVGLSTLESKHGIMNRLDLARQSLLAGTPHLLKCVA
jgi:AcrR family transcriptional regulator